MTIEAQANLLKEHHKAIEALDSVEAVLAYADRVHASGYEKHIADELLHHLERRRGELLRKTGALCP
jgi:hypothetical protein